MSYLGLDIGTSAVKALVVDDAGSQLASATAPLESSHPHPGWSEQNPDDWVAAAAACCSDLRQALGRRWQSVGAIGLSGQMHGATLLDETLKPVRPAILWNDGRSAEQCNAINRTVEDIESRAGIFAMPGFTAPKVLWCAQMEPDVHARIAHLLLPKDYVRLALTGERVTDMADAAGTLWLDQKNRRWDDLLCKASRTDPAWLPALVEGTEVSGLLRAAMATQLGLPAGIPVAGGGGDAAAGALGIGAVNEGDAFASLGTSGQLFVSTNTYRSAPGTTVHCYAHCVPKRWFQMACMLNGASPMSWFSHFSNRPISDLLREAETISNAPLFLPYLTGERTPHNDANIRGAFYGLGPDTSHAHAMRAVVEAIAYSFCDANDCLKQAGTRLQSIASIGGGTRSNFVLQTMADALGVVIQRYRGSATGPALGAARLAMVASGVHDLKDVVAKPEPDGEFEPRSETKPYHDKQLSRWRELYQALKPVAAA
ncbi:xylulokinase [Salaquimonas pukyongi]|uniref:xylulokinase n=1 Tax=Salaquimonas pukyongi TaxID=2712698 RepID=UPI0009F9261F|nr:xylulokinase [Salaquimonas pukyongi]